MTTPLLQTRGVVSGVEALWVPDYDLELASRSDLPVLLSGDSLQTKIMVARQIHELSGRHGFMELSASGADSAAELFGHTGWLRSGRDKPGMLEMLHGGTLVLHDIDRIHLVLIAPLQRFLESGATRRLGGEQILGRPDVRIISTATGVTDQTTHPRGIPAPLFYRLNGVHMRVPAVSGADARERPHSSPPTRPDLSRRD